MSNCQIRFKYIPEDVVIQCQRNELMRDIINQYAIKSEVLADGFSALYIGDKKNMDSSLAQINDKDKEILIIVWQKKMKEKLRLKNQIS